MLLIYCKNTNTNTKKDIDIFQDFKTYNKILDQLIT